MSERERDGSLGCDFREGWQRGRDKVDWGADKGMHLNYRRLHRITGALLWAASLGFQCCLPWTGELHIRPSALHCHRLFVIVHIEVTCIYLNHHKAAVYDEHALKAFTGEMVNLTILLRWILTLTIEVQFYFLKYLYDLKNRYYIFYYDL